MSMRVALISDLHGNEVALDAVLSDAAERRVDRIVCLGDVATLGPRPGAVLDRLRELGCPCILGNHDAFMLDAGLVHTYSEIPIVVQAVDWCRAQLTAEQLAFIGTFAPNLEIPLEDDGAKLFVFHGTPRSHMTDILATTPAAELDALLEGATMSRTTVMAGGHTHIQMLRQHRGTLIVNPGSVGLAFKEHVAGKTPELMPLAEYAIVEATRGTVSVDLRRVGLDKARLRAAALASPNPIAPALAQMYA